MTERCGGEEVGVEIGFMVSLIPLREFSSVTLLINAPLRIRDYRLPICKKVLGFIPAAS